MITEKQEIVRNTVYEHLYQMYSRFAFECFPYLTNDLANIISMSAYQEMIQMAQEGNLRNYYERIKRNAV